MKNYDYLIVGGGMTAAAAAKGIREVDATGSIGMFSKELDPPYNRPPLTKSLWKGKPVDSVWRKLEDVDLHLGRTITRIDPDEKSVECDDGTTFGYGKLLLATGGTPRLLPFANDSFIYYRTLADYHRLRKLTEQGGKFAVIGGGFIGTEIAAALTINHKEVVMIFPGKTIGERIFPADLSNYVNDYYQQKGIELIPGERVTAAETRDAKQVLKTDKGREILVDGVVVGIGIEPDVALAKSAGVKTDNGILVDEYLQTSQLDIYAAGDVASFPMLGSQRRVEHEDNANSMGECAGRNMAGQKQAYDHLPLFYSDMFDLGYEAVGTLDSRMEIFANWKRQNEEGVIYYLKDDRVRGVLLWNVWGKVDAARELIAQPGPTDASSLKGHIA